MSKSALYYKLLKILQYRTILAQGRWYAIVNLTMFPSDSTTDGAMCFGNRCVRVLLSVKDKNERPRVLKPGDYDVGEMHAFLEAYLNGEIEETVIS